MELAKMNRDCSLPDEWLQILFAKNPPYTLYQLQKEVTMVELNDALELLEIQKLFEIEEERINRENASR